MTEKPVYIIGSTPLACYLTAKISESGKRTVILAGKQTNYNLSASGFSIKEDHCLRKSRHKPETSFWIKEAPEMVIIAASNSEINALASAVSPRKIIDAPLLCFTGIFDKSYLEAYFKQPLIPAFFDGYLYQEGQDISILGRSPRLIIDSNTAGTKQQEIKAFAEQTALPFIFEENSSAFFWDNFIPYTVGSLMATAWNQNFGQLLKNKVRREEVKTYVEEMVKLSGEAATSTENLLKKLHTVPLNYKFSLQEGIHGGAYHELEYITSVLSEKSRSSGQKYPKLGILANKIYNIIMA